MQDRRLFNEMLFTAYEGMSEDRLLCFADETFDNVLKRALYPNAKELVQRCRDEGQDVVLVSGALDFCEGAEALVLGAVALVPEKARLIREHAKAHGYDLNECFAYSDSYSDVPMLSVVGHPAAVNPDARLTRLANAYGWPILSLESHS